VQSGVWQATLRLVWYSLRLMSTKRIPGRRAG
jgi:hypothetical protein